jgi:hypothetical protein
MVAIDGLDELAVPELLDVIESLNFVTRIEPGIGAIELGGVRYVTLRLVSYGYANGNDLDAANYRELLERYGNVFFTEAETSSWYNRDYSRRSLYLINDRGMIPFSIYPDFSTEDMIDTLRLLTADLLRLVEYPLLSEESHSEYVDDLAGEAWSQWLWQDVLSELEDLRPEDDLSLFQERVHELYYGYEHNEWSCETAVSVVNLRHEEAVAHVAKMIFGEQ